MFATKVGERTSGIPIGFKIAVRNIEKGKSGFS
jgi:hypothetical protein